jgi:hypothetical protein
MNINFLQSQVLIGIIKYSFKRYFVNFSAIGLKYLKVNAIIYRLYSCIKERKELLSLAREKGLMSFDLLL